MRRLARLLVYAGTAGTVLGLCKLHAVRHHYDFTGSSRFGWAISYVVLLAVTAYGVGLPDLVRSLRSVLASAVAATAAAALGVSIVQLVAGDALLPRFVVFASALLLVPWYVLCAALATGGAARAQERDRVAVVAGTDEAETLRAELGRSPERPAQVVVALTAEEVSMPDPPRRPLVESVVDNGASVVVLAREAQGDETIVAQAAALHEAGLRVRTLSLFYEEWLGKLPIPELERVSLMFDIGELHRARYGRMKRVADVAAGLVGSLVLVVAIPFVVAGDLVGNQGSLFYRQPRVGRNGKEFSILKFRTMRPTTEWSDSDWTAEADPRVTAFGRVLRRTHVDELPQVLNILRGDLSLVGPRPEQPRYVAELVAKIPFYDLRHLVRPGLTGWAQVKYGYAGSESDALEKLQYEFYYLRHQSLRLDGRILGRTIRSVIGLGGR